MKTTIEKEFPLLQSLTYLNTAASGLLPKSVLDFRRGHDDTFFNEGSRLKLKQDIILAETRESVGRLFNCPPSQVALVPNFSFAYNTLLEGFPQSHKFLLLEGDYPSVNWPVETRNFSARYAKIDLNLEDNIRNAFAEKQPDVFAFSIVQYISGIKIDLKLIDTLKREYPQTMFIADGTQYCGSECYNFENSGIDVLGASCYKWLNAGYGNGIMLFKSEVPYKISPKTTGFNSVFGKYKQQDGSFIGKFEPGHQDTLNYGSLNAAIALVETLGMAEIEQKISEISKMAKNEFINRGLLDHNVVNRNEHSSIFNLKGDETLFQKLNKEDVLCSQRGNGIRVSFNYFNSEKDLERLLSFL